MDSAIRLTDDEVAAVDRHLPGLLPPDVAGVAVDLADGPFAATTAQHDADPERGLRSLYARGLVTEGGDLEDTLLVVLAVYAVADRGVSAIDLTAKGVWQRSLYGDDDALVAHSSDPAGLHVFTPVEGGRWAALSRVIICADDQLQSEDVEATTLEDLEVVAPHVVRLVGLRPGEAAAPAFSAASLLVDEDCWVVADDGFALDPLTAGRRDELLAHLMG